MPVQQQPEFGFLSWLWWNPDHGSEPHSARLALLLPDMLFCQGNAIPDQHEDTLVPSHPLAP